MNSEEELDLYKITTLWSLHFLQDIQAKIEYELQDQPKDE